MPDEHPRPRRRPAAGCEALAPPEREGGEAGSSAAIVSVLGREPIIGRNLARRFRITLERGKRVWIEP